jgi:hypothetical protein
MNIANSNTDLVMAVKRALTTEIEKIVEEEAEKAADQVQRRVRDKTMQVAVNLLRHLTMERDGNELVIRMDFDKDRRIPT